MRHVLEELERLQRRTRLMLLVQRFSVVAAIAIAVALVFVILDFGLRLPSGFRLVLLVGGLGALGFGVVRYLGSALGFRPSLTQLALRVEGSIPSMSGRLASSVEFVSSGVDRQNPLAARTVRDAESRLTGESMGRVVEPGRTLRGVGCLVAILAIVSTLVIVYPAQAQRGVARLLLPYGATQWPARTAVASLMHEVLVREGVHPRGQALALRARNLTVDDADGRVDVRYRMMRDGVFEDWELAVLTPQGGGVHERLVDANAERVELYFETEDANTAVEAIKIVPPPAIVRARITSTPPAYARTRVAGLDADLGPGLDERAVTERPLLVGSRVEVEFELNKPLPSIDEPSGDVATGDRDAWIRKTFGWLDTFDEGVALERSPDDGPIFAAGSPDASSESSPRWRLAWTVRGSRTLSLSLVDEHGLANDDPIRYRIDAVVDQPPSVTITDPPRDDTVLPTAVVAVAGEAKDDVSVVRIGLAATAKRAGGAAAEALPFDREQRVDVSTARIEADLDLAALGLSEGDVVLLTASAEDNLAGLATDRGAVVSPVRRLRILSEIDFVAQLRRQLAAVRQNAIRVESLQTELQDDVIDSGVQPGVERAQAQVVDRIAAQRDAVGELQDTVDRNRLDDQQLSELLQQSRDLLEYAGRAANRAVEAAEARASDPGDPGDPAKDGADPGAGSGDDPGANSDSEAGDAEAGEAGEEDRQPAEADRPLVEAQQEVREELADLIELLDRDEDTWVVQRQLEGILDDQTQLEAETTRLAQETIGQPIESLTPAQETELDRITRRQRELRDQSRRLIEEMRRRAAALEEMDPQAASGMRTAADTGERLEVDRDMETAASRAEQNQLQSAGASQQAAGQKLARMLEDLQETKRARAEELLRQLASLIESIDRLISFQENELIALANAEAADDYSGRDRAMIRLSQNTQAVAVEARAAGQQSRRIARSLDRASDAQGAAVAALRAAVIVADDVREAEERTLTLLKEAREQAAELEEKTQEEQVQEQREKLIEAYRELAERQVAVRAETLDLAQPEPLTRRQLVEARRIGSDQHEIRTALIDLEAQTSEIVDSEVFSYVHKLIDKWSEAVSAALWEGKIDVDVTDRQRMIADSIARQIEALEESLTPPDEFADDRQQNEQGQGGSGPPPPPPLIPPVAEVKRLHGLQEQVYNQTQEIDRREDLTPAQSRQRVRELGEMQREIMRLGELMLEALQSGPATGQPSPPAPDPAPDPNPDPIPAPSPPDPNTDG